ncbi:hypothetical protein ABET51_06660 [Metabacillus fastidiosus]|uniref:hypothetical protein n=1 Tax=Metabacillus fastidiosus TaxID=1458 RepID=UPI003D27944D
MLSRNERFNLLTESKKKGLKMTELAIELSCSVSLLSQYFNSRCNISDEKEGKLKEIINKAKEFEYRKVYLD